MVYYSQKEELTKKASECGLHNAENKEEVTQLVAKLNKGGEK